jgi:hypothetical protein
MPTANRRVAAYLPKEIDDRFSAFKSDRGIEGDSQALITILSEFLGVSQKVTHSVDYLSSFATKDELTELNLKVAHLVEQVQNFDQRLDQVVSKAASELKDELLGELPKQKSEASPGQLDLLNENRTYQESESSPSPVHIRSDTSSDLLAGLSGRAIEKRFKEKQPISRHAIESHRDKPDFSAWSAEHDPEGIAWEYRDRKYYPVQNTTSDSPSEP